MTRPTESERLYVVETKIDTVLTAVEKTNTKIDELSDSLARYATRLELEEAIIDRNTQIAELKKADAELAKRHALQVWVTGSLSAVFGAVVAILIKMAFE